MAVDRGGLEYRIHVQDEFSASTQKFREEIRASRQEFAGLRTDMAKSAVESRQAASGHRQAAQAVDVRTAAERKLAREVRAVSVERATQAAADAQAIKRTKEFVNNQRLQNAATQAAVKFERERRTELDRQARAETADARARKLRLDATAKQGDATRSLTSQIRIQQQVEQAALAVSRERTAISAKQAKIEAADAKARAQRRSVEAGLFAQQEKVRLASLAAADAQKRQQVQANTNLGISQEQLEAQKQFVAVNGQLKTRTEAAAKAQNTLNASGTKSNGIFQNLFFTFRRLIGVFAAFLIARQLVAGLVGAVREAVRFNAEIEQAQLGIAAVITAAGQVRDPLGQMATSAQQFALAQKAAAEQVKKLRKDALVTSATFEQLLQTFQIALGPGLAAGLNLDEVRKLTVRISQAATAIGLEQNQLAEEVRSILSGTIQLRTTRIAAVLGITNQDIKNARELGVLTEFLDQKFSAFAISGEAGLQTFNVILSNLGDAISNVLAAGGEGLFNSLKALFQDLSTSIATVNQELGEVQLNPKAVAVVEAFLDGLRGAVDGVREAFGALSFDDLLQSAKAAGTFIAGAARLVATLVVQFIKGANIVAGIFNGIASAAKAVFGFFDFFGVLSAGLGIAAQVLAVFSAISGTFLVIRFLATSIFTSLLPKALVVLLGINAQLVTQLGLWGAIRASIAANPIGFVLTAVVALLTVIGSKMGLFDKLFGSVADKAGATKAAMIDLKREFESLDAQISGALDTSAKFGETIKGLTDDLREVTTQTTFDLSVSGLSGNLRQQADLFGQAQLDLQNKSLEISNALEVSQSDLLGIQRKRALAERDIVGATTEVKAELLIVEDSFRDLLGIQKQQAELDSQIATQQLAANTAAAQSDSLAAAQANNKLASLKAQSDALKQQAGTADDLRARASANFNLLVSTGKISQQQADELLAKIHARIDLEGQENSTAARIADLTQQRSELEDGINKILNQRLIGQLAENLRVLGEENVELALKARQLERVKSAQIGLFAIETQATELAAAANVADEQQVALQQLLIKQERELADAKNIAASATDPLARQLAEQQVLQLQENQTSELKAQNLVLDEAIRKLELQKAIAERPIELGFTKALEDFALQASDKFAFAVQLMSVTLNGFADLISSSIVDAFDPTKKVDLKERFARFLQEIATLILNQLAKVAVAKAALGLFGGGAGGVGQGISAALFAKKGGVIPRGSFAASAAHFGSGAQAFDVGGVAGMGRPAGVPRSDTVPAWLTPGEPVTPVNQAKRLGYDFFEAIRQGKIDPFGVRLLMGGLGLAGMRSRGGRGPGFADGGVASATRAAATLSSNVSGGGDSIVAPTERAAARILAGGKRARRRAAVQDRRALRGA